MNIYIFELKQNKITNNCTDTNVWGKKRVELKMLDQSHLQCNMGILGFVA